MALYEIQGDQLRPHRPSAFSALDVRERQDLQPLLRDNVAALDSDLLVVAEEFSRWQDARRRIDLLAIGKDGRLVVIELKRTDDGGYMELQALRYAAMVSAMEYGDIVDTLRSHLRERGDDRDAESVLADFLEIDEEADDAEAISSDVRILLVSADFSKELTTSVLWLNGQGIDITCVRVRPYEIGGHMLLDVQQLLPLPEAAEYQVSLRRKEQERDRVRRSGRDFTKYHIVVDGDEHPHTNKRRSVLAMVAELTTRGVSATAVLERMPNGKMLRLEGRFESEDAVLDGLEQADVRDPDRWFIEQPFVDGEQTFLVSKMWGLGTEDVLEELASSFPEARVGFRKAD